ncbi:MAG: hypothetical protein WCA37_01815 [Terracidiphilus sp.]
MTLPKVFEAGSTFSIRSNGSGKATLYIIGPGQVLKRVVQLGEITFFPAGSLSNTGHYLAVLAAGSNTASGTFDVAPTSQPAELSFLAKPSRLPVDLKGGITGAVYVFDAYRNLISTPALVSFELSSPGGSVQKHVVVTHDGAAWTGMDSTALQGTDRFVARIGDVSRTRVVQQVPGDPCGLKMSARQSGQQLQLATETVRDCRGNALPDGTIVTFTESFHGTLSTVDVPIKRGIAEVKMPIQNGAAISVASGVVLGNQIEWGK